MVSDMVLQLGPLALPVQRVVALVLILAFVAAIDRVARHFGQASRHPAMLALVAGLLAARGVHVWQHRESFALDPLTIAQVWLGGWSWPAGVAAAALVLLATLRAVRPAAAGLAVLAALSLIWWGLIRIDEQRALLRLPADLEIAWLDGERVTLRDLRGRPVVLNLWASWCPPCRREMPMLIDAARREQQAHIVLVNQGEAGAQVRAFLERERWPSDAVALDPSSLIGTIAGSGLLPTTLFVDANGIVRQVHAGEISRVQLDMGIRSLVRQQEKDVPSAD